MLGVEEADVQPVLDGGVGRGVGFYVGDGGLGAGQPAVDGEDVAFEHGDVGGPGGGAGGEEVGVVKEGFGLVVVG